MRETDPKKRKTRLLPFANISNTKTLEMRKMGKIWEF